MFPKSPPFSIPPGLPEPITPPPDMDRRTTRQIMLDVERKLDTLIKALDDDTEEEPEERTLDGQSAGKPRDQTRSLG